MKPIVPEEQFNKFLENVGKATHYNEEYNLHRGWSVYEGKFYIAGEPYGLEFLFDHEDGKITTYDARTFDEDGNDAGFVLSDEQHEALNYRMGQDCF